VDSIGLLGGIKRSTRASTRSEHGHQEAVGIEATMRSCSLVLIFLALFCHLAVGLRLSGQRTSPPTTKASKIMQNRRSISVFATNNNDNNNSKKNDNENDNDNDNDVAAPQKSKGPVAYMKQYGLQYFLVWFAIYLPFLLTFFWGIENDVLHSAQYDIDPPSALNALVDKFEQLTHDYSTLERIRGSVHAANFAAAYLLADLVPTTVLAVGALSYITKMKEGKEVS